MFVEEGAPVFISGQRQQAPKEVVSGETHHAACFRLQIDDTVVNGMDYILLDADGKIAEVSLWWRPLPSGVQMQGPLPVSSACSPGNFSPIWSNGEARPKTALTCNNLVPPA